MWGSNNKVWTIYGTGFLAADRQSAAFLANYMCYIIVTRSYLQVFEIIDLQKYKLVKSSKKLKQAINERLDIPFVFLSCNN